MPDFCRNHSITHQTERRNKMELKKRNKKEWIDSKGNKVQNNRVTDNEKYREYLCEVIQKTVTELSALIQEKKNLITEMTTDYLIMKAQNEDLSEWKGNAIIRSFDGKFSIERRINEKIDFTEDLQLVKQHFDICIKDWSKTSRSELSVLINDVFKTDNKGQLNKVRLLSLLKHDFDHQNWKKGIEILRRSIRVESTKEYYRFFQSDESGKKTPIIINFSEM